MNREFRALLGSSSSFESMLARELVVNELAGENRADTAEGAVCFLCGMKSFFAILVFGSVAESEFPGSVHELLVRELVVEHRDE